MTLQASEEKIKPFRLVKYFTFTSLIVMFLGAIVLSMLNTHWVRTMLQKKSEEYALLLVENLNHQVFLQFIIPVAMKYGKIQLRNKAQFERMDKVVRSTLHSFKVDEVNIYDMNNIISYSFDKDLIGKKNVEAREYRDALSGKSTSNLAQRGSFWEILMGLPKESKVITFAPLRAEKPLSRISGPVLGVVKIVQDLSDEYKTIFDLQVLVIKTCAVVMGILFLVLLFVVKRGEGIIQRRTRERIKLKEQLNRSMHLSSLGEMTAGISHEIRNPLGIISSSAEHLKKKMAKLDPSNTIPDIIIEESGRLNNIITDFLNFAKPKNPDFQPCRVEGVIEKNLTFLASQIKEHGYTVKKYYSNKELEIEADSDMLYQAFLNILMNSMQAMPGGGKIHIAIGSSDETVIIILGDEGEGIPDGYLEKIWDPFFTTKENGTGLGLGVVKNIIESHGGKIRIDKRPVNGVQVTVELPVKQKD